MAKTTDESSGFFYKYFGEEKLNLVNKLYEGEYKKNLQNPSISDDLITNVLIIKIVVDLIKKKKNYSDLNEKEIIDMAFKKSKKFIEKTSEKNFCQRINTLIDRYLKEINNEKLL